MATFDFRELIQLLLLDMIKNGHDYENQKLMEDMIKINTEDELVGKVDRDLPYEYQMDRVKVVGGSPHNDTLEKE